MSTEHESVSSVTTTETIPQGTASLSLQQVVRSRESFFLSASEFAEYEATCPGAAERLLTLME